MQVLSSTRPYQAIGKSLYLSKSSDWLINWLSGVIVRKWNHLSQSKYEPCHHQAQLCWTSRFWGKLWLIEDETDVDDMMRSSMTINSSSTLSFAMVTMVMDLHCQNDGDDVPGNAHCFQILWILFVIRHQNISPCLFISYDHVDNDCFMIITRSN